jgi:hypothetical protein
MLVAEQKNHAVIFGQLAPEHQAMLALRLSIGDFDIEKDRAVPGFDFEAGVLKRNVSQSWQSGAKRNNE